jgi:CHAT domain-containing protein
LVSDASRGQASRSRRGLATAFQLAGYRHVISTLWSIAVAVSPQVAKVAKEVYWQLKDPEADRVAADGGGPLSIPPSA